MRLREYVDAKGRGEITRIVRVAEVANTTVHDALKGHAIARYDTAKRISEATGGLVSIEELCEPSAAPVEPTKRNRRRHASARAA